MMRTGAVLTLLVAGAGLACAVHREPAPTAPARVEAHEEAPVLLHVPDDPTVTFEVVFPVGSQDDPAGKEGLAWLTGHLLAEGSTLDRPYGEILEALYPMAAGYSVRVDREMTVLSGRVHRDNVEPFFALFTAAYARPAFADEDLARLSAEQLDDLENVLRYQQDEELGKAALYGFAFEGTPYAHPPQGTVSGVRSIGRDDVVAFYRRHFTRGAVRFALGGGFDPELVERFTATRDALPPGAGPSGAGPEIRPKPIGRNEVLLVDKPGADASISFGFPIDVRRGERDFYALWIANSWLGEHRNSASHLYQVIRAARGLNYGDYSYIEAFPEGGARSVPPTHVARRHPMFEVWIRTLPNGQAPFALRAALRELDGLVERGLTEEQFELTREFLRKYVRHFADNTASRLGYAVDDRFYGIGPDGHLARFRRMLDELTLDEVNAAVRRHLRADRLRIAIVTGDPDGIREALTGGAPTPIEYASPKDAAVLAEDREIEAFPLAVAPDAVRTVPVATLFEH